MNYEDWNRVLAGHFFNAGCAGKRVYLHTTKELLRDLSKSPGGDADFITAVKQGPADVRSGEMCSKALKIFLNWRAATGCEFPPYVAYLCLFALAAGHDGNWPRHAYYPRLWDLLGEDRHGAPLKFRSMSAILWRDLETWTHTDKRGELGLFKWHSALDWEFVGLPIAQTILTEEERAALPELFSKADLEPGAGLLGAQIAAAITPISERRLRKRTLQLLLSSEASDYRSSLFEILQGELDDWDGSLPQTTSASDGERRAGLRLWLKDVDPAGFITCRVVAHLPEGIEADEMILKCASLPGKSYECLPHAGSWTDSLQETSNGAELDASAFAWERRVEFRCDQSGVRLVFPAATVRVFSPCELDRTGYIEARKIPSNGEFFVCAHSAASAEISAWGSRSCGEWSEIRVAKGIPANWRIFKGAAARFDAGAALRFPALAQASTPQLKFQGGVRAGNSAGFFPFALPKLFIDWREKPNSVKFNGVQLDSADGFIFEFNGVDIQPVNTIEAEFADQRAQLRMFVMSDGWTWGHGGDCLGSNRFGLSVPVGSDFQMRGAEVKAPGCPPYLPDADIIIEEQDCPVLLGRVPGQIVDLRRGHVMPDWAPVWAVKIRRRQAVFAFCGASIESCRPAAGEKTGNPKRWAEIIWVNRRRTEQLKNPRVRALLAEYREVGRAL